MELGPDAPEMHRQAGREIAELGIDVLWGVRGLAAEIVSGAAEKGIAQTAFFESSDDAAVAAIGAARQGDLILVKGSRSVETDKVVKALRENYPLTGESRER